MNTPSRSAMPLHPALRALVDAGGPPSVFSSLTVAQVRARALRGAPGGPVQARVAAVHNLAIDTPAGPLALRVYVPQGPGPHPTLVFFHGGGFVVLDLDSHDYLCLRLCDQARCVVVSVDYRLAPEHRFPAGVDDALLATRWAALHAAAYGGDPQRLAVAGVSAGACLAAVVAQRARDEGGPALAAQLLCYPVTDHPTVLPGSYRDYATGYGLTAEQMLWFWQQYLPDEAAAAHPHASPLRMVDCAGLPPAYLMLTECDVLSDEGVALARRYEQAGVPTVARMCHGMNHSFLKQLGSLPEADQALDDACGWLRRVLQGAA